jgi:hypothetical protein
MVTQTIQRPISCSACDDKFSTKNGNEMREHYQAKHDIVWSGMKYQYGWTVGSTNTYRWLHSDSLELDEEYLRKCDHCNKPYIAYNHQDDCDECLKLDVVQKSVKYSYNRSPIERTNHYTHFCKVCGEKSNDGFELRSHGELQKIDGKLQYICNPI